MSQHYAVLGTSAPVTTVKVGARSIPAPFAGQLVRLVFSVGAANSAGASTFDVKKNGVSIFSSPAERPSIASGQRSVVVSGLEIEVAENDVISWDAVGVPLGGLAAPVTCTAVLDDLQPAGLTIEEADGAPQLLATTLKVGNGDLTDEGGGVARLRSVADVLGVANGAASLDSAGKIPTAQLPALAINDVFTVASQAAMLALTAQRGDIAVRSDVGKAFILASDDPTQLADWVQFPLPSTLPPSGAAGGDLAGTYPNPTLAVLAGLVAATYGDASHIPQITIDTKGRITAIAALAIGALALAGDVTGTLAASVVTKIRGFLIKDFGTSGPTIADDFNDDIFDTTLWQRSNISNVVETGGRLEMYTSGAADWFQWAVTRDMTNRYASFKYGPNNTNIAFIRMLLNGGLDYLEFRVDPATAGLKAGYHVNGGGDTWVVNRAYNPSTDTYLKFQHQTSDGKWHFFVSGDGVTWTDIGNCSPPGGAGQSAARFFAYSITASVAVPIWFDNFDSNIPQASTNLADGETLVYRSSTAQFENFPVGAVEGISAAPGGPPANAKPGQCPVHFDMVNHRLYIWNPNTSSWDWRSINNS